MRRLWGVLVDSRRFWATGTCDGSKTGISTFRHIITNVMPVRTFNNFEWRSFAFCPSSWSSELDELV